MQASTPVERQISPAGQAPSQVGNTDCSQGTGSSTHKQVAVPSGYVSQTGPDHEKRFHVECWLAEELISSGSGASKKQAEQSAARAALARLRTDEQPTRTG